jgi:hypothetical protein
MPQLHSLSEKNLTTPTSFRRLSVCGEVTRKINMSALLMTVHFTLNLG